MPGSKVHTKSDITDFASMNSEGIKENFGTDMQHTDYCIWLSEQQLCNSDVYVYTLSNHDEKF